MSEVEVTPEVKREIETRVTWARALVIRTPQERAQALDVIKEVKGLAKAVEASFDAPVKAAHAAWKAAVAHRDSFLAGPTEVERLAKAAIIAFDREEEIKRVKEQARLQAIADEQARKERERLEKQAEKVKSPERAEALREQAASVAPVAIMVPRTAPKGEGESTTTTWKARVVDAHAFIKAAAEAGRFEFVKVDESGLNDFARRTQGKVRLSGVEFYSETRMNVRVK
jgi:hypothetical protein